MSELEDSNGHVRRDEAHERWLAMQSAYADYLRASEVFENSRESTRDSADQGRCDLTLLDCRRDAFERYLEARMDYLERRYDESYRRDAAMVSRPTRDTGGLGIISRLAGPKWPIIPVLVVGILSVTVTVFSFVREQKHVRDLDSARGQIRASLSDTREELQSLAKKLDAWESTEHSAVRQVEHTAQTPAPAPQVDGRKPSGGRSWRRLPERIMKTTGPSVAARGYFSLSRSSQFKRVGPIIVSLKSVDMQRNSVDVSIVSESGKVKVQHLRLNQPVWIKRSYRGQPMELVVDRITANGVSGHLTKFHG
jgi:hypothetical protein